MAIAMRMMARWALLLLLFLSTPALAATEFFGAYLPAVGHLRLFNVEATYPTLALSRQAGAPDGIAATLSSTVKMDLIDYQIFGFGPDEYRLQVVFFLQAKQTYFQATLNVLKGSLLAWVVSSGPSRNTLTVIRGVQLQAFDSTQGIGRAFPFLVKTAPSWVVSETFNYWGWMRQGIPGDYGMNKAVAQAIEKAKADYLAGLSGSHLDLDNSHSLSILITILSAGTRIKPTEAAAAFSVEFSLRSEAARRLTNPPGAQTRVFLLDGSLHSSCALAVAP